MRGKRGAKKDTLMLRGTKWELFRAAVDLFAARGYEGVGVRDIAAAVGIRSASLYNHFEDKEAILRRIFDFFEENYLMVVPEMDGVMGLVGELAPAELLERALPQFAEDETFQIVRKIWLVAVLEAERNPRAEKIVRAVCGGGERRFEMVLKELAQRGLVGEMNPRAVASALVRFDMSMPLDLGKSLSFREWQKKRRVVFELVEA